MYKSTEKQKDLLLNLLLQEFKNVPVIKPLLKDFTDETEERKFLLLNLLYQEPRNICNMNANIKPLLKEYTNEQDNIYKIICKSNEMQ